MFLEMIKDLLAFAILNDSLITRAFKGETKDLKNDIEEALNLAKRIDNYTIQNDQQILSYYPIACLDFTQCFFQIVDLIDALTLNEMEYYFNQKRYIYSIEDLTDDKKSQEIFFNKHVKQFKESTLSIINKN